MISWLLWFYRKYVKGFGQIADPLYKLLAKDQKFDFTNDCQIAFETLKEKLITAPVLQLPDYGKDFYLFTDCSDVAGGYSWQYNGENGQYRKRMLSSIFRCNLLQKISLRAQSHMCS